LGKGRHAFLSRVDSTHGDIHSAYGKMGSPTYPTQIQLKKLRRASELSNPEKQDIKNNELNIQVPVNGLVMVEIR
jgi:beta-xylosidase